MSNKVKILVLLTALVAFQTGTAQDTEPALRDYVVELVIFRNLDLGSNQEVFPKREAFGDAVSAYEFLDGEVLEEDRGPVIGNFTRAPQTYYKLSDAVLKLRQSSRYRPILHMGWIQPGFERDAAEAEPIKRTAGLETIDGTATLTASNYLHLDMDIVLEADDQTLYQLREKRKMRRNETHYFDHPQLGIIAVVTRLDELKTPTE